MSRLCQLFGLREKKDKGSKRGICAGKFAYNSAISMFLPVCFNYVIHYVWIEMCLFTENSPWLKIAIYQAKESWWKGLFTSYS